jgi:ribonuclease P/MRP protein subunit POP5
MVRIKNRYLLVQIIYPVGLARSKSNDASDLIRYYQPTTDHVRPASLVQAITAQVRTLFGDFGAGTIDRSLQGIIKFSSGNRSRSLANL